MDAMHRPDARGDSHDGGGIGDGVSGALLLFAYAAGMAVPFLLVAFGLSRFRPLARTLARHRRGFQVASGVLIVGVGVLVATNAFSRLAGLVPWSF